MFYFKILKSNSYLTSPSIQNDTTFDKFINTTYEVDVPVIDNEWKYYIIKYGKEFLNSLYNRSTKKTLKGYV